MRTRGQARRVETARNVGSGCFGTPRDGNVVEELLRGTRPVERNMCCMYQFNRMYSLVVYVSVIVLCHNLTITRMTTTSDVGDDRRFT